MTRRTEKGICGICPAGCGVTLDLEDDRIVKVHPWKEHIQGCLVYVGSTALKSFILRTD